MNEKKLKALKERKARQLKRDKALEELVTSVKELTNRIDKFEKSETKVVVEQEKADIKADVTVDTTPVADIVRQFKKESSEVLGGVAEVAQKVAEMVKAQNSASEDIYARYTYADSDDDGVNAYIGYVNADGDWFIQRITRLANATTNGFAVGKGDYSSAWSKRKTFKYKLRSEVTIP